MKAEERRVLILKTVNLLLICAVCVTYQQYAFRREKAVSRQQQKEAEAADAWRQVKEAEKRTEQTTDQGDEQTSEVSPYQDGTYEGSGKGFGGDIRVQVVLSEGKITSCQVLSAPHETPEYLDSAEAVLDEVVAEQSSEVDTVSGATLSSNGLLDGVREALKQAEVQ